MIEKISKIYHVGDIHIRNFKRHKEYQSIFDKLFDCIESTRDANSIIYLAGDIVHSKTDMTPELFEITSRFLKRCADLCPTILICGNHDVNLANSTRLDALTPMVNTLNHPNLYYWKDTGVYYLGDICFSVYSVFGSPTDWVRASSIEFKGTKIALHHGAVFGSSTDLDHIINNEYVKTTLFDGYDMVMLGDIHKRQFLNEENTIHYCGSTIQQSHGETLEKGITVWDVPSRTSEFIQLKNEIGYVTLDVQNGKILSPKEYVSSWPKRVRLRIKYENTTKDQIQTIISAIKSRHVVEEVSTSKNKSIQQYNQSSITLEDVRDIEYQNKLITEYLESRNLHNVDSDHIRHINRLINAELNSSIKLIRNVTWKPLLLEFSNMFSYGPGNILNFNNLTGIQGIFAPNAQGKSSLLDVFTYCIYDKCSRAWKAKDVLNNRKTKFSCKLSLDLNGETYFIERAGYKDSKKGNIRVEVDFYKIGIDGNKQLLNGDDRDQTNKLIRDYLGTYDDFLLTTLSTQNDNKNFIFKKQGERKELLYSFLDLSVFDSLQTIAKKTIKEKSDSLWLTESELSNLNGSLLKSEVSTLEHSIKTLNDKIQDLQNNNKLLQADINELNTKIIPIDSTELISTADYDLINKYKVQLQDLNVEIETYNQKLELIDNKMLQYNNELKQYDIDVITKQVDLNANIRQSLTINTTILKQIHDKIDDTKTIISKLDTHEYNPECEYCISNEFVKDAMVAQNNLPNLINEFNEIGQKIELLQNELEVTKPYLEEAVNFKKIEESISSLIHNKNSITSDHVKNLNKQSTLLSLISTIQNKIDKYNLNKESLELNKITIDKRTQLQLLLKTTESDLKDAQNSIIDKSSNLLVTKTKLQRYEELIEIQRTLSHVVSAYNSYIDMMSNDGIPYIILQEILPVIETEVNSILLDVVDFTAKFESDDKNNINCYLVYSDENSWPVEMASGMERFIISIAIRCALVDITSLPRPVFLAIDEGFGVLDAEKIGCMTMLFDYMKTKFNFIIAVSHVDTMRDMVDGLINIHKTDHGFSEVKLP